MTGTSTPAVDIERDGRIATITLCNAPVNALSHELASGLADCAATAANGDFGAVVVRSAVPGFFAAGADLRVLEAADDAAFAAYLAGVRRGIEAIAAIPVPTIAAIDGQALGGGLELALACTFRVAAPTARLGVPEVKLGLLPGAGGTQRLPRLIGRGPALDLLLSGRSVSAEEAAAMGLVSRVSTGPADEHAGAWARRLVSAPGTAVSAMLRCVDVALTAPPMAGMAVEEREIRALFATQEAQQRIEAFFVERERGGDSGGRA